MFVTVTRNYEWSLGFASDDWRMEEGDKISLMFRIDKSPWLDATAFVIGTGMLKIPMASEATLIKLFQYGRLLQIRDRTDTYSFDLGIELTGH